MVWRVTFDPARRVTKRFGETVRRERAVARGRDGEFMVLVGPSGSARRPRCAARRAGGDHARAIRIGDRDVNDVAPRERDIAMVFQDYALYPQMSVRENLAFGLRMRKLPKADIERRVSEAAGCSRSAAARAQAARALGRPAAARRARPRARARPAGVPHGRAALEPRREAARADPRRDPPPAARGRHHHRLRHARPGRGDDDGRPHRGHARRRDRAGRRSPTSVYERPANTFVAGFIGSPAMSLVSRRAAGSVWARESCALRETELPGADGRPSGATRLWGEGAGLVGPLDGVVAYVESLGRETLIGGVSTHGDAKFVIEADGRRRVRARRHGALRARARRDPPFRRGRRRRDRDDLRGDGVARIKLAYVGGGSTRGGGTMASFIAPSGAGIRRLRGRPDRPPDQDRLALVELLAREITRTRPGHHAAPRRPISTHRLDELRHDPLASGPAGSRRARSMSDSEPAPA